MVQEDWLRLLHPSNPTLYMSGTVVFESNCESTPECKLMFPLHIDQNADAASHFFACTTDQKKLGKPGE
jgi:hypothetical protein